MSFHPDHMPTTIRRLIIRTSKMSTTKTGLTIRTLKKSPGETRGEWEDTNGTTFLLVSHRSPPVLPGDSF